jgi:hypothetical protein
MFTNCINIKHKNSQTKTQIENAIKYFENCLVDIQSNGSCYEQSAYKNTKIALKSLRTNLKLLEEMKNAD